MIILNIIHAENRNILEVPEDMGLNLMEVLKGEGYETIEGTCGGMALCATCHIKVVEAYPLLSTPTDDEMDMLETLPKLYENSRLGCQIKMNENLQSLTVEII